MVELKQIFIVEMKEYHTLLISKITALFVQDRPCIDNTLLCQAFWDCLLTLDCLPVFVLDHISIV